MDKVVVENGFWDGPRSGITIIKGMPYRFVSDFGDAHGRTEIFSLYSISQEEMDLEQEQWSIFINWNNDYEAGKASTNTHPANGGISDRWDELEETLNESRNQSEPPAFKATAIFKDKKQEKRYDFSGPDYIVQWSFLKQA